MEKPNLQKANMHPDPELQYYDARQFLLISDDREFVDIAYACILKREPDKEGFDGYCKRLAEGGLRQQVMADLVMSEEGRQQGVVLTHLHSFRSWSGFRRRRAFMARLIAPAVRVWHLMLNRIQRSQALQLQPLYIHEKGTRNALHEIFAGIQGLEHRVEGLEQHSASLRGQYRILNCRFSEYENRNGTAPVSAHEPGHASGPQAQWQQDFDDFYLEFEIAFRGSRDAMRERLEHYLAMLPPPAPDAGSRVVDLGCGRGEWLTLLQASGYTAHGLDSSPVMLEICREQGLNVSGQPMHLWLKQQPDASVAAITAFHIAEHLPFEYLLALVKEAKRLLQPGGVLIIETQNPESLRVSAYAFYHDPTHRNPLTPELLEFTARYMGFDPVRTEKLSEVPEELHIREETETAVQFNRLLNAPRDLALVACQPGDIRRETKIP